MMLSRLAKLTIVPLSWATILAATGTAEAVTV